MKSESFADVAMKVGTNANRLVNNRKKKRKSKFERCVLKVKKKTKKGNPYAICRVATRKRK